MPRYFQSLVASRPLTVDGQAFTFERIEPMGGSWLGVLAVDDESSANKLAAAGLEITQAEYEALKKKVTGAETRPGSSLSRQPMPPPQALAPSASPVARNGSSGASAPDSASEVPGEAAMIRPLSAVSLQFTAKRPPPEPLIDAPADRKSRRTRLAA